MQYVGGKAIISKRWSNIVNQVSEGAVLWEPFCGGLNASVNLKCRVHHLSDANEALITMWRAVIEDDWMPDLNLVSRQMHAKYEKNPDPKDPWTAFLGFCCSFSGVWFGGYTGFRVHSRYLRDRSSGPAVCEPLQGINSVYRTKWKLEDRDVTLDNGSFMDLDPPDGCTVVYCDPPYEGTEGYKAAGQFDHPGFWARCRELSDNGLHVFVSELKCPGDFEVLWRGGKKRSLGNNDYMEEILCYRGPGFPGQIELI